MASHASALSRPVWLIVGVLLLAGCGVEALVRVAPKDVPAWPTASPEEVGLNKRQLDQVIDSLPGDHSLRSVLLIRHKKLVYERYFAPYDAAALQDLRSATKSITSLLVGTCIDRHEISGVDAPMMSSLRPEYPNTSRALDSITIEHLLTMRSGLDCDDSNTNTQGQEDRMYGSQDWVEYFLSLKVVAPPGTRTRYCTGGVVTLGRIAEKASGKQFDALAKERLFSAMGIRHARYQTFDNGQGIDSGGHLRMLPRDFAKFGELVLRRGRWEGTSLVSEEWIEASTSLKTDFGEAHTTYGYLWWRSAVPAGDAQVPVIYASGNGGQVIFIVPSLDLVAAMTGGNYNSPKARLPFLLLAHAVLPALSEEP